MARKARSGQPGVEDYLRAVGSDPVTEWFTGLLREKNEELQKQSDEADRLARALRAWHSEKSPDAESKLVNLLREIGIIDASGPAS
jgi:hypothetical protein